MEPSDVADDEYPEFTLTPANWQAGLPFGNIKRFVVAREQAVLCIVASDSEQVWVWYQGKVQVNLPTLDAKKNPLQNIFMCASGHHCIISLRNGDNYYVNVNGAPSIAHGPLPQLKGVHIDSVGWEQYKENSNCSSTSTGDILIGSSTGSIYQTCLDGPKWKEKYTKKVYQLDSAISICGIHVIPISASNWLVLLATSKPTRLYEFVGGPSIENMFKLFEAPEQRSFRELPGDTDYSSLSCQTSSLASKPKSFMLLCEAGLYTGSLSFTTPGKLIDGLDMLYFPTKSRTSEEPLDNPPLGAMETEFHYILMYPTWLVVLNKLDETTVFEQRLDTETFGTSLGMCFDIASNGIWCFFSSQICKLEVKNEDGSAWKLYLEQAKNGDPAKFDMALSSCKTPLQRDRVLTVRADRHFALGEYNQAAEYYASTTRSFEDVALMLIEKSKKDALRSYLQLKLKSISNSNKTQQTIISVWLVELFLAKISELTASDSKTDMEAQFHQFLIDQRHVLGPAKDTIYKLITSHGRDNDYLAYCLINGDYERVVVRYIQRGKHSEAIKTLAQQSLKLQATGSPPDTFSELFYKYSPELMEHCSIETVDTWIDSPFLDASKLIPALIRYTQHNKKSDDQSLRYLEHCVKIQGNQDEAIHNLLVSIYAQLEGDSQLRDFLASPDGRFDLKYALRVCTEQNKTLACIDIYSEMGLFSEAVELALTVDPELAKMNADMAKDSRSKLWLRIAKHMITDESLGGTPIQRAISVLKESDSIKIEEILQFLPDIEAIGDLKEEICHALEQYGSNIERLKNEMADMSVVAEAIRKEIGEQDDAVFVVNGDQNCDICGRILLNDESYVFPCAHAFHCSCLLTEMSRTTTDSVKIENMYSYLELLKSRQNNLEDNEVRKKLKSLDNFVRESCPYCGDIMIESISDPFITRSELQDVKEWEI